MRQPGGRAVVQAPLPSATASASAAPSGKDRFAVVRGVALPLVIGLAVRLVLAPYTSWPHDDVVWYQATVAGQHHTTLYGRLEFPNPPLWGYLLQGLGWLLGHIGVTPAMLGVADPRMQSVDLATGGGFSVIVTSPLYNVSFKAILFVFDVATGLLIRHLALSLSGAPRRANLAFAAWFLNPFVIYETAVHGGFDVIVAFFTIASVVLLLERHNLLAGLAVGLGILTKVAPIFIVPLLVAVAAGLPLRGGRLRDGLDLRGAAMFCAGGLLSCVALFPEVLNGTALEMLRNTFTRIAGGGDVGGLCIFGLKNFRGMTWISAFAISHRSALGLYAVFIQFVTSLGLTLWALLLARRNRAFAVLAGISLIFAALVLLAPLASPQYVLWFVPELIVVSAVWMRGGWSTALLCAASLLFPLALLGGWSVVSPLAEYTDVIPVSSVVAHVIAWQDAPGALWGIDRSAIFTAPASLAAIVAFVTLLIRYQRAPFPRAQHA